MPSGGAFSHPELPALCQMWFPLSLVGCGWLLLKADGDLSDSLRD